MTWNSPLLSLKALAARRTSSSRCHRSCQDQSGRLWDVLFMAAYVARANASAGCELLFELYRVPRGGQATETELTTLKRVVGPGDEGEPVITILLPNQD